jgi:hypothetical protein
MSTPPPPPPPLSMPIPAPVKPGKVQAIAIMTLIGGILAAIWAVIDFMLGFVLCITFLMAIYEVVLAVLAISKGAKLLGANAHLEAPPKATAIMQIINIVSFDVVNLVLGILILVFLSDRQVESYYQGR